jgi:hypothetical protein
MNGKCILVTVGTMYILKKKWLSLTTMWCYSFAWTQKSQISDFAVRGEFVSLLTKTTCKFTNILANLALRGHSNTPDQFVKDFLQKPYLVEESVQQPFLLHFWIPLGRLNRSTLSNFI